MGIWKEICYISKRVVCGFGSHDYDGAEYIALNCCTQVQVCRRPNCDSHNYFDAHIWSEWKYHEAPNSCIQMKICERCDQIGIKLEHKWGEWVYSEPKSCKQIRSCTRCDKSEQREQHQWDDWKYKSIGSCIQVRSCRRCPQKEEGKEEEHDWSEWEEDLLRSIKKRICKHCGQEETVSLPT